ncbi:sucrose transport protein SUC1-like [Arachis ipaensis]|uniref:sucrose transport protein SUC1-like n=1 Tax=Arachis ipaensis TaxID=130454 RepID=UPI000A2B1CB6|nr:sucrose transport protein SUC1-like [Arachis ipaensis]XP_025647911.1 sucrose transport protein SUC1-like [Arachis hypogaea]
MGSLVQLESGSAPVQPKLGSPLAQPIPAYEVLRVPHRRTSLVWLGGVVSYFVLHSILSYYGNRSTYKLRRHRPFILAGAVAINISLLTIGFIVDISNAFGDILLEKTRPCAIAIFGIGFWIMDTLINIIEVPCKNFLEDLAASDQRKIRLVYTFFSFFIEAESVLGYFAAFLRRFGDMFPLTVTKACDRFYTW